MSDGYLLGIDCGLTVTKAVIFDLAGNGVGISRAETPQLFPAPGHVERDMDALWSAAADAIRQALAAAKIDGGEIAGIGAAAHGDGIFLLTGDGQPLGNGILSLDSRAVDVIDDWRQRGICEQSLALSGQEPHAAAPSALLAWLQRHEPERFELIGSALHCKDWLRYRLCGEIATDRTEASASFTNVHSQIYDPAILDLFDLTAIRSALPTVGEVMDIAGGVTPSAAQATGLKAGTPVVFGMHDVTATAVGMGGVRPGVLSIVAGTYSINEVLSSQPEIDRRWFCRNGFRAGEWNNMSISPASSANSEWMLRQFCRDAIDRAKAAGRSVFDELRAEIDAAFDRDNHLTYVPYLFGSPRGGEASASLLGLQGWHDRGDVLRAVLEGIAFNHREHVDALRSAFPITAAGLAGGGALDPTFGQLFSDALGLEITIVNHDEVGALGVALAAGVGVGCYGSIEAASTATHRVLRRHEPDVQRQRRLETAYQRYRAVVEQVAPLWPTFRP